MPARIVLVHDDGAFLAEVATALAAEGHEVAVFEDSFLAWDALGSGSRVEILITRIQFAPGHPHGIALAHQARVHRPEARVLFVARPEFQFHAAGLGTFLPLPVNPAEIVATVSRLLAITEQPLPDPDDRRP